MRRIRRPKRTKIEVYRYKGSRRVSWIKALAGLALAGVLLFAACFAYVMTGSHSQIEDDADIMIILGCQVKPWGPSILLQDRLDTALDYLEDHPDMTVVVSGGKGDDEHKSEAQAMYDYLAEHGVDSEQIILEDRSANTHQNLIYTTQMLTEMGYDTSQEFVVVSNGFHLSRVRMLWERVLGTQENLNTLAAPSSHVPSRLKMYVREPLALIKSFVFDR